MKAIKVELTFPDHPSAEGWGLHPFGLDVLKTVGENGNLPEVIAYKVSRVEE